MLNYDGETAGFAVYFFSYSTFLTQPGLYLEDLYVRPALRGKGIGRALLIEVTRLARKHKCGRLEWAVLDWNEPAIRFYQDLGASALGGVDPVPVGGFATGRTGRRFLRMAFTPTSKHPKRITVQ